MSVWFIAWRYDKRMSVGNIKDIDVPLPLQKKINRMGRSNQKFLIQYEFLDKDNEPIPVQVYFDLKPEFFDTLEEFRLLLSSSYF